MNINYVWLDDGSCDKDGMGIELHVSLSEERGGTVCLDTRKGDPLFADIIQGKANGEAKTDGQRIYWANGASLSLDEILSAMKPFPPEDALPPLPCERGREKPTLVTHRPRSLKRRKQMSEELKMNSELNEDDLAAAAGGATQNRWDAKKCSGISEASYDCVGFLGATWCDHYRYEKRYGAGITYHSHRCVMGRFNYTNEIAYDPGDA